MNQGVVWFAIVGATGLGVMPLAGQVPLFPLPSRPRAQALDTVQTGPPPTDLTARATSPISVTLSWTAAPGASDYAVSRWADSPNDAVLLNPPPPPDVVLPALPPPQPGRITLRKPPSVPTSYTDAALIPDTRFFYSVTALYPDGRRGASSVGVSTPPASPPANRRVEFVPPNSFRVRWDAVPGATGYRVYKGPASRAGALVTPQPLDPGTTVIDVPAGPPDTYAFQVQALYRVVDWPQKDKWTEGGSVLDRAFAVLGTNAGPRPIAIVTHHNDNSRTGVNANEQILDRENVTYGAFQLLYRLRIPGHVYAQPLFVPYVPGKDGRKHNYLILATELNKVFVFDQMSVEAEVVAGVTVPAAAKVFDLGPPVPYNFTAMRYTRCLWRVPQISGDPSCTPDPFDVSPPSTPTVADPRNGSPYNVWPMIGVTSTPVIDTATMRLYVVAKVMDATGSIADSLYCLQLVALSRCAPASVAISGSFPRTDGNVVVFNPRMQHQRPALLLANGQVYVAFGSHHDTPPWQGWIVAYNALTLQQTAVWCSTPNISGGSIWQAGGGPAADENGNLYVMTGNADFGQWRTPPPDYPMSFVKLSPRLTVMAFYQVGGRGISDLELDLGSSGPVLLGASTVLGAGKQGILYNFDRDLAERQEFQAALRCSTPVGLFGGFCHHVHGVPVVWRDVSGTLRVYLWPEKDHLKAFRWDDNSNSFVPTNAAGGVDPDRESDVTAPGHGPVPALNMPGGALSLSSDGTNGAILWASLQKDEDAVHAVVPGVLRAFDAYNLKDELWNSEQAENGRDRVGLLAKYTPPTVTYGRVFLATFGNAVNVYGLRQGAKVIHESVNGQTMLYGFTPNQLTLEAGQSFNVSLFITNTGFTTWRSADHYALGSQAPPNNTTWGSSRVSLPKDVAPYETVQLEWTATAPSIPGTYDFRWSMVQDGKRSGDNTPRLIVTVSPRRAEQPIPQAPLQEAPLQAQMATLTVTPAAVTVPVGGTTQLSAALSGGAETLPGAIAGTVSWSSSSSAIATVSANGVVTGVSAGDAVVTASSLGKSATAAITVASPPQKPQKPQRPQITPVAEGPLFDAQYVLPDEYFAADAPLGQNAWITVTLAKLLEPASAATNGQARFLSVVDGSEILTDTYWKTRIATAADHKLAQLVVVADLSDGGLYRAPASRDEALGSWWMARITDLSGLATGYVTVSGPYKVRTDALRVPQ